MPTTAVMLDTCVWLSIAANPSLTSVLDALERFCHDESVVLVISPVIQAEFDRNCSRVVDQFRERIRTYERQARMLLPFIDSTQRIVVRDALSNGANTALESADSILESVARIRRLFAEPRTLVIESSDEDHRAVIDRSLSGLAPFHRRKNSVADALIMQAFHRAVLTFGSDVDSTIFVTENTTDFSSKTDLRLPHDDYAHVFATRTAQYSIDITEVLEAIRSTAAIRRAAVAYTLVRAENAGRCFDGGSHCGTHDPFGGSFGLCARCGAPLLVQ